MQYSWTSVSPGQNPGPLDHGDQNDIGFIASVVPPVAA